MAGRARELRDVQRNLRAEIDALGARLAFLNILGCADPGGCVRAGAGPDPAARARPARRPA